MGLVKGSENNTNQYKKVSYSGGNAFKAMDDGMLAPL
jgi:hypothetical protein